MTKFQLIEQIKDLPDDMPVVFRQEDNPDLANCDKVEVVKAYIRNDFGYDYFQSCNSDKATKVLVINAT